MSRLAAFDSTSARECPLREELDDSDHRHCPDQGTAYCGIPGRVGMHSLCPALRPRRPPITRLSLGDRHSISDRRPLVAQRSRVCAVEPDLSSRRRRPRPARHLPARLDRAADYAGFDRTARYGRRAGAVAAIGAAMAAVMPRRLTMYLTRGRAVTAPRRRSARTGFFALPRCGSRAGRNSD